MYAYAGSNPLSYIDPLGTQLVLPGVGLPPPPIPGNPGLGQNILDVLQATANASAEIVGSAGDAIGEEAARQSEYLQAKNFCDTPPPPGSNDENIIDEGWVYRSAE